MRKIGCWDTRVLARVSNRSKLAVEDRRKGVRVPLGLTIGFAGVLLCCALLSASSASAQSTPPTFTDYQSFAAWMRKLHKAPFMGNAALKAKQVAARPSKTGAPSPVVPQTASAAAEVSGAAATTAAT